MNNPFFGGMLRLERMCRLSSYFLEREFGSKHALPDESSSHSEVDPLLLEDLPLCVFEVRDGVRLEPFSFAYRFVTFPDERGWCNSEDAGRGAWVDTVCLPWRFPLLSLALLLCGRFVLVEVLPISESLGEEGSGDILWRFRSCPPRVSSAQSSALDKREAIASLDASFWRSRNTSLCALANIPSISSAELACDISLCALSHRSRNLAAGRVLVELVAEIIPSEFEGREVFLYATSSPF